MQLAPDVIKAAQDADKKYGVPASITLAQFGQESGWGAHQPGGTESYNPFGIKAMVGYPTVIARTSEFMHGRYVRVMAKFCKFPSYTEAFDEHAKLIATHQAYDKAMNSDSIEQFANALTGVYATDPHYGTELITLMDANNLYQYDQET